MHVYHVTRLSFRHRKMHARRHPHARVPSQTTTLTDWQRDMLHQLGIVVTDTWHHYESWADFNESEEGMQAADVAAARQRRVASFVTAAHMGYMRNTDSMERACRVWARRARDAAYAWVLMDLADTAAVVLQLHAAMRTWRAHLACDAFERPADYDSSDELERFHRANQPSPDTTMLMMLGSGTKRTAAFDQPTRDEVTQETMLTLVTAWCALLNDGAVTTAESELRALAMQLGITRVHASTSGGGSQGTLSALATAMAPLVWPERYAGIKLAISDYNGGKQSSTCMLHYSKINKLVRSLGGIDSVRGAVFAHQADTAMLALATASAIQPSVSVVIGTTGEATRPVLLRLFVVSRSEVSHSSAAAAGSSSTLMPLHAPDCMDDEWSAHMLAGIEHMADESWVDVLTADALAELDSVHHRSRTPSPGLLHDAGLRGNSHSLR